jgi:hypothetical protein
MPLFLLQLDLTTPIAQAPDLLDPVALLTSPLAYGIYAIIGLCFGLYLLIQILRAINIRRNRAKVAFGLKVLMVRVPKELSGDEAGKDKSQQQIQELIGAMETVFSTVGALKAQRGFGSWFSGRSDLFTFEIVCHRDKISFFVTVPEKLRDFMEQQILAQYPNAQIDEVPDYNIFSPNGVIMGSYLKMRRPSYFPIKLYTKLEADSMNSITNALSKIEAGDGVAIQYVVRSAKKEWRQEGLRIARAMQQGKKTERR